MSKCTRAVSFETAMMLLLALIVVLGLTAPGKAQTLENTFEIDSVSGEGANAIDEAAKSGTDWDSLYTYWLNNTPYPAGWDLDVYTGVIADYGALDTTRFGEGTKDIQDIPAWAWQALPPNDKVDITNAQAALFSPGSGNLFLYMEADRFSNLGDAAMGLWLLQDSSFSINSDGTFNGHHIAGTPGPGGPTGDLLILAHYTNGGGVDSIAVYEWVGSGGNSDNLFGSQGSDAFDVVTKTPSQAFATVNDTNAVSPWPYLSKNGTTYFEPFSFFEGALDLGTLLGGNVPCFAKFLFETRESQSLTSALKDFGLGSFSTTPVVSVNSDTVCTGGSAQLCATVEPGTGISPFTYSWVGPGGFTASTQCITATTAGNYGVVVTGDNGCKSDTIYGTLTVVPKPILTTSTDTLTCDSTNASTCVTVTNSGATGPVHYKWTGTGLVGSDTLACARWSIDGSKKVVVTTMVGCIDSTTATIAIDTTKPVFSTTGDQITCDSTAGSTCATLDAGFKYAWTGTGISGSATGSCARWTVDGWKKVTVTKLSNGCSKLDSAFISIDTTKPVFSTTGDQITCDSTAGSTCATFDAGFSYAWTGTGISGPATGNCARWTVDGWKKVTVTKLSNGCSKLDSAFISIDTTKPVFSTTGDTITCDSTAGSTCATFDAGFSYAWAGTGISGPATGNCARWTVDGWKKVTVTKLSNGCSKLDSAFIAIDTTKPVFSTTGDTLTCTVLTATTCATFNAGYTYSWSGAGLSGSATGNCADWTVDGWKTVLVTRTRNGCTKLDSAYVKLLGTKPTLTVSTDTLTCDSVNASTCVIVTNAGSLIGPIKFEWKGTGIVSGGTSTCARWNDDGTKWVIVTDSATGCKDSISTAVAIDTTKPVITMTTDTITCTDPIAQTCATLDAGYTYSWTGAGISGSATGNCADWTVDGWKKVLVTRTRNGCTKLDSVYVPIDTAKPVISMTTDTITCADPTAQTCATLDAGYSYSWTGAGISGSATGNCADWTVDGWKKVLVTRTRNGCTKLDSVYVPIDTARPVFSVTGDTLTCDVTTAQTCATFNAGFTYLWSGVGISGSATGNCANWTSDGWKTVLVTKTSNGCTKLDSAYVLLLGTKPTLTVSTDTLTCDSTNASTCVTVTNAASLVGTIQYAWSGTGLVSGGGLACARWSIDGVKKVVVTDLATGCKDSINATIAIDTTKPVFSATGDTLTCVVTTATTCATLNAGYSYSWTGTGISGSATGNCANWTAAGWKTVLVKRLSNGCTKIDSAYVLADTAAPTCSVAPADTSICPPGNVTFCVHATGGKAPYTFSWTGPNGFTGSDSCISAADSGTYKVVVTGTNGCVDTCQATLRHESCIKPCTFTMGGWGSGCPSPQVGDSMSTQPGCVRDYYFTRVFPNGVIVGDQGGPFDGDNFYAAKWTTAKAIEDFLPAGQTPKVFNKDYLNPLTTNAGVAAGQILALKLNVGYSCAGIFSKINPNNDGSCYGDFIIPDTCHSKFVGLTVNAFLVIADRAISGDISVLTPYHAKISDVSSTAQCLNELFDGCDPTVITTVIAAAPAEEEAVQLPKQFDLSQNYPNPFNPRTVISYSLPTASHVSIEIFNVLGQRVTTLVDEAKEAGVHSVAWDAGTNASGIYFYRLTTDSFSMTRKMLLLK